MSEGRENEAALQAVPSFDALFAEEYPRMVALASAVSGSRQYAEDIAQEAMDRLSANWPKIQGYATPGAWVRRVTINLALSQKRRFAAEAKALLRLDRSDAVTLPTSPAEHEPVWTAVAALPGKQRAAVSLYYLEDRSIDEIADILDVAPSTARVHLHRARQTLRDQLEREDLL